MTTKSETAEPKSDKADTKAESTPSPKPKQRTEAAPLNVSHEDAWEAWRAPADAMVDAAYQDRMATLDAQLAGQPLYGPDTAAGLDPIDFTSTVTLLSAHLVAEDTTLPVNDYLWDFGDGTPRVNGPDVTHDYATAGSYTVALYAFGRGKTSKTVTTT